MKGAAIMSELTEAVQRMQNYIEAHLDEKITLSELSEVSLYSPWYSYRIFREFTNSTIADYIRRLRLSRSALKLRDESCRVIDAAFELGFGSVDGYQRAFFREFGCNPGDYVTNPVPLYLFIPYGVESAEYFGKEKKMEEVKNVFVQLTVRPARKVLIKRGVKASEYWSYCQEVGCDVWGLLTSIKSVSGEPVCMWLPEKYVKQGTSVYVQGVEVPSDYDGIVPDGFDVLALPEAEYLMFRGEPFEEKDYCEAICQVQKAMEKYDPSFIGYEYDDNNPRIQLEPIGKRGYIELIPVKKAAI